MNELKEFAEFGLYPWVTKRAALKLNSAFNAISTAASKEVVYLEDFLRDARAKALHEDVNQNHFW